jgi:WD40 repeat protein
VTTTNSTADAVARASVPTNLLDASREALRPTQRGGGGGRSSQDAIVVDDKHLTEEDETNAGALSSALQAPVLLDANPISNQPPTMAVNLDDLARTQSVSKPFSLVALRSNSSIIDEKISTSMRRVLVLRESVQSDDDEIRLLQDAMAKQEETARLLAAQRTKLLADGDAVDPVQRLARLDEIKEGGQNCDRVIAQLHRKRTDLQSSNNPRKEELQKAESDAHSWFQKGKELYRNYRDPFREMNPCHSLTNNTTGSRVGGNPLLLHILDRQRGITCPRFRQNAKIDLTNRFPKTETAATTRKTIFGTRLSHAATINTHLNYPVYCLRFDRTGRYFITGADDYLIKVHYLGAGQSCRDKNIHDGSRRLRCNYGANTRGSVLVCSLRGHAGVINDIDVSSDNCFLATASVDGDCRIWGLKDGCPVAILRGHKGGANMVRSMVTFGFFIGLVAATYNACVFYFASFRFRGRR